MLLCAIFSACTKWVNTKKRERKKTLQAEAMGAALVALIVFCAYMIKGFDAYAGYIACLLGGFGGVRAAEMLSEHYMAKAAKKAGISLDEAKQENKGGAKK